MNDNTDDFFIEIIKNLTMINNIVILSILCILSGVIGHHILYDKIVVLVRLEFIIITVLTHLGNRFLLLSLLLFCRLVDRRIDREGGWRWRYGVQLTDSN